MEFWKKQIRSIIILAVATVLIIVYAICYNSFLKPTYIDLSQASTDPTFMGLSGEGKIETTAVVKGDFDASGKMKEFYDSLYFEVTPCEYLCNGDEVIITAIYDEEYAKKHNITVHGKTRKVTVSGLTTRYGSSSDLSKAVITKLKDNSQRYLEDRYGSDGVYTFQAGYFQYGRSEESVIGPRDNVVLLYKVESSSKNAYIAISATKEINSATDYDNLEMAWYGEYTSVEQAEVWITTMDLNDVDVTHFE